MPCTRCGRCIQGLQSGADALAELLLTPEVLPIGTDWRGIQQALDAYARQSAADRASWLIEMAARRHEMNEATPPPTNLRT